MDEDKIISAVLQNREEIEVIKQNMVTKQEMREVRDILEGIATMVKKIDEDHTFAIEWLKRLQTQVERQEEDIRVIKLKLGIA